MRTFILIILSFVFVFQVEAKEDLKKESISVYDQAMFAARVKDYTQVINLLEPLADQGDAKAQYQLAGLYRSGRGVQRDLTVAFSLFQEAAHQGYAKAQYQLGVIYEKGLGVESDIVLAKNWYQKAGLQGHEEARAKIAKPLVAKKIEAKEINKVLPRVFSNPEEELRWASKRGLNERVGQILKEGVSIDSRDEFGRTALIEAATHGFPEVIRTLLQAGADVNLHDKYQNNALLAAVDKKNNSNEVVSLEDCLLCIRLLIDFGANTETKDRNGNTPFIIAAKKDKKEIVALLSEAGANIYAVNIQGYNASNYAQKTGNESLLLMLHSLGLEAKESTHDISENTIQSETFVKGSKSLSENLQKDWSSAMILSWRGNAPILARYLEENSVEINKISPSGYTALSIAAEHGYADIVELLLNKGAVTSIEVENGMTPLHLAAKEGHTLIVEMLLAAGANIDSLNRDGMTPLSLALQNSHDDTGVFLLRQGANGELADNRNNNPIHLAVTQGLDKTFNLLLALKVDVNRKTDEGSTALFCATEVGSEHFVNKLLKANAKPNLADNFGNTPLLVAAVEGHKKITASLFLAGADIHAVNSNGNTALHLASNKGHLSVVNLLLNAGSKINSTNNIGNSPLMLAVENEHVDVLSFLLSNNASLRIKNKMDERVFSLASDNVEIASLLSQYNKGFARIANFF